MTPLSGARGIHKLKSGQREPLARTGKDRIRGAGERGGGRRAVTLATGGDPGGGRTPPPRASSHMACTHAALDASSGHGRGMRAPGDPPVTHCSTERGSKRPSKGMRLEATPATGHPSSTGTATWRPSGKKNGPPRTEPYRRAHQPHRSMAGAEPPAPAAKHPVESAWRRHATEHLGNQLEMAAPMSAISFEALR